LTSQPGKGQHDKDAIIDASWHFEGWLKEPGKSSPNARGKEGLDIQKKREGGQENAD